MDWCLKKGLMAAVACLIAIHGTANAASPKAEGAPTASAKAESSTELMNFQASGLAGMQSTGGNTFTGQVAWTPRMALGEKLGVRGVLGGSLFKGGLENRFMVADAQALASYNLSSLQLEAGGGMQMWLGQDVLAPIASANVAKKLNNRMFGLIDRFVLGYSYALGAAQTHQAKLGIGISL